MYAGNNFLLERHVLGTVDSTHVLTQFSAVMRLWSVEVRRLFESGV